MKKLCVFTAVMLGVFAVAYVVPALTGTRSAAAAPEYLDELNAIAEEFSGELLVFQAAEAGEGEWKAVPLDGPRRMAFYTPQISKYNRVFAGACYALHINGNPEVVIAIEKSRDGDNVNTYIEVSRLSGAAMNVYRNDGLVAQFPEAPGVEGAYVGLPR